MLDSEKIKKLLKGIAVPQDKIFVLEMTDSTNTRAREYAKEFGGTVDTVLFLADGQTKGRGRLGKSFHSECGKGIYMTLLLSPDSLGINTAKITAEVAVKLSRAIEKVAKIEPQIKWVNDIYATPIGGDKPKKVAGILAESELDADGKIKHLYLGLGINVYKTDYPEDISSIATSIEEASGNKISREELAAEVVREILSQDSAGELLSEYRARCITLGKKITVRPLLGNEYSALAIDVLDDFSLLVKKESGARERVFTGEVSTEL